MVADFGIAFGALAAVGFFKTLEFEASLLIGPAVELGAEPLPSCRVGRVAAVGLVAE